MSVLTRTPWVKEDAEAVIHSVKATINEAETVEDMKEAIAIAMGIIQGFDEDVKEES